MLKYANFNNNSVMKSISIGDFTGMVWAIHQAKCHTSPPLSREDVLCNAETYKEQIYKISIHKTKIVF